MEPDDQLRESEYQKKKKQKRVHMNENITILK